MADNGLTAGEQERRREWFREHWAKGVPFNRHCALEVRQWDAEAVELFLPYADELSAHTGIFHGGVVAALLDTRRCTRRGRSVHFAEAQALGVTSGKVVATGQIAVNIAGERPGAPWVP